MKAIQAKYKDDKQRQQQEIMKFYKENEINPFASFLPLLAQIPVFIGLYYTLRTRLREDICPGLQAAFRHAYALHHHIPLHEAAGHTVACHGLNGSSWLFIHDLTNTATGLTLVVLIVLYVGTQLASSLMMQAPTMDRTQRRMLLLLPLLFVIFIINFPAGLILYWITTNTWTLGQQWVIRRRIGSVVPVAPAAPIASSGGRDGARAATIANADAASGAGELSGLLRGKPKSEEKHAAAVGSATRTRREAPPPPPPRKKKTRSGRRR
jgi:YidC/Oxa1 family membrane protein insertase